MIITALLMFAACQSSNSSSSAEMDKEPSGPLAIVVEAESFTASSKPFLTISQSPVFVRMDSAGWLAFDVEVPVSGRYRTEVFASAGSQGSVARIEDFYDNTDGRFYDVSGAITVPVDPGFVSGYVDGSPLKKGVHRMKLHLSAEAGVDKMVFTLLKERQETPKVFTQNMEGDSWETVWADEFEGESLDTTKWTYAIGNWGWGNNELQYYTANDPANARLEDGKLIIEARKSPQDGSWTSARLTTREKETFLYGKIEFRAQVPREKGNWAAGWTLGDAYVDESSWPYCGEIDILESVGYEVNDETGDGIAHATVHTPAYYFKINNQISSVKEVPGIANDFHTYSVIWTPTEIKGYVDDIHYYTYDKNANEREWPFNQPQNIILNLAMGGGWGGAQGMDTTVTSQLFIVDYVRVSQLH